MFGLALLFIAIGGFGLAAYWDLKTTEVPDQLPYAMIGIAILLFSYQSIALGSYVPIVSSLAVGLSFLAFGFIMYHFGQWGGADMMILAAIGFFLPALNLQTVFPYPLTFVFNVFLIGAAYMLVYALAYVFINKQIVLKFVKDLKASTRLMAYGSAILFIIFLISSYYVGKTFLHATDFSYLVLNSIIPLALSLAFFLTWKFAKAVEEYGFKRQIPVSKLTLVLNDGL